MLANQVVKQRTNDVCQSTRQTLIFTLNIKALSLIKAENVYNTISPNVPFTVYIFVADRRKDR